MINEENNELYLNNYKRKSFQWEIWSYCNQKCIYCYNGALNLDTIENRQLTSIADLNKTIDTFDFNQFNNISIIGGEMFQGECHTKKVSSELLELLKRIAYLYNDKKIGSIWITCTLTKENQEVLYEWLDYCKDNNLLMPNSEYTSSGLWLCTSWDIRGRFHNDKQKEIWHNNMKKIKEKYPFVKFNTTIILMEPFLQAYIDGEFSIKEFAKEYDTTFFFKQPTYTQDIEPGIRGWDKDVTHDDLFFEVGKKCREEINKKFGFYFFPRRDIVLKFLIKLLKEEGMGIYDRLFNIRYRSDELHRNLNYDEHDQKNLRFKDSDSESSVEDPQMVNKCGHISNYTFYADSNKCCACDKKIILDMYG